MDKERKRFFIETFGCQMNVNDSEKVAGLLLEAGHEPVADAASAELVFINTCAVREKAAEKLFSSLGRFKRLRDRGRDVKIAVGGCVAQLHRDEIRERAPEVDVLVGTQAFHRVSELFEANRMDGVPRVDLARRAEALDIPAAAVAHSNPYRAFVTVMEGCNHVCSFCVVPRTRGPELCRAPAEIVSEVAAIVAGGVPEVMLLGQTVNAYRHSGVDFADLVAQVASVPGLERLRFTTSHPSHMTAATARALGGVAKLCPYIHLPVQSGSDRILSSMRRGYTRTQYLDTLALLRSEIQGLALSSDVIVGYPGETEPDFLRTLSLVDEAGFDGLFVFAYSPRPGTVALRLPDDVPEAEKLQRLQLVNGAQQRIQARRNRERVGRVEPVLLEGRSKDGRLFGRTPQFRIVHVVASPALLGQVVQVEITAAGPNSLQGTLSQTVH